MIKKVFLIITIFLFVGSLVLMGFNINNYNSKLKKLKKYQTDIANIKASIEDSNKALEDAKANYEKLTVENSKGIEDYNSWSDLNEEIKKYLQ